MIREITAFETFLVRHPVLRNGKPIETCHFEDDNSPTTKHFGFFDNDNLVGVISLFQKRNDFFEQKKQFQIRGMAVLENYQKKGFGNKLVRHCENLVIQKKAGLIWFNARIIAVPFYEKLGYQTIGNKFEIGDVGLHFVMHNQFVDKI
jgi:GNAT superfamily N-acetyltransferase